MEPQRPAAGIVLGGPVPSLALARAGDHLASMSPLPPPPSSHRNFAPVVRSDTRLLILGSLPGVRSLVEQRYYAHPRNHFWRLIGAVAGEDLVAIPYEERLERLLVAGIGLWDTVAQARRDGSLDSRIRLERASDVDSLAARLPALEALAFNGATAARIGRQRIERPITRIYLPSSSPAYTLAFERKLDAWLELRRYLRR